MRKFFTQTDTIKFVYNELSPSESTEYLKDLDTNESTYSYFNDLIGLLVQIDSLNLNPSDKCVTNILSYANLQQK